ncbi:MAG TPA: hypothetical protein PLN91_11975, partial [Rhodanobacteraceae bacterium]|nr:hypothetical protein [Rhodanobacteraceae bacterium]
MPESQEQIPAELGDERHAGTAGACSGGRSGLSGMPPSQEQTAADLRDERHARVSAAPARRGLTLDRGPDCRLAGKEIGHE